MTSIYDLVIRIFLSNIKKYRLFLLCNTGAIAILFSMISLVNNDSLMNSRSVDSMISSNIYAPTALVIIFVAAFVPYTYSLLIKDASKVYGILNSIGMLGKEVNKCILVETLLLGAFSIIGGVLLGNILSVIVYLSVYYGIGIQGLKYENSLMTYMFIFLFAGALYVAAYIIDTVKRRISNITDIIINKRKSESGEGSIVLFGLGVVVVLLSFVCLLMLYGDNSNIAIICFVFCVIGIIVLTGNAQFIFRRYKGKNRWTLALSDFLYYYKRNIRIILVSFGMFFMILLFTMFTLVTFPNFENNARIYNPYHITYPEYPTMEWRPTESDLIEMTKEFGTDITIYEKIDYLYIHNTQVFSVSDIQKHISRDYQVDNGQCISVKCEYLNDGYEHNLNDNITSIKLGNKTFKVKEVVYDVLFGKSYLTQGNVLIISDNDFAELVESKVSAISCLNLLQFEDYKKTIGLERLISETIADKNVGFSANDIVVSSRAIASRDAQESSGFLLFLVLYVSILFYISVLIMIHYKFEMEAEEDIHRIRLLQSIGASQEETQRILHSKVSMIFLIPFVFSMILTIFYGYGTNFTYGYGLIGVKYAIEVSVVWLIIVVATIEMYYRKYRKKCEIFCAL